MGSRMIAAAHALCGVSVEKAMLVGKYLQESETEDGNERYSYSEADMKCPYYRYWHTCENKVSGSVGS
jgi:hypothetical protein